MLNGLSESQIKELNEELAKLPSCFGEVKEAILSGNRYVKSIIMIKVNHGLSMFLMRVQ